MPPAHPRLRPPNRLSALKMAETVDVGSSTKATPKPPSLAAPQDIVTVIVGIGSASQIFKLPKDTLCYYSPVFASAFNGSFLEGNSQTMTLDDIDGPVFGLLVAWLYTKDISDEDISMGLATPPANLVHIIALRLAKLWVLCQRFLIPTLQNQAMTKLHPLSTRLGASALKQLADYVYSGEYDELRNLVSGYLAFKTREHELSSILEQLPQQALVDVTRRLKSYFQVKVELTDNSLSTDMGMLFVKDGTESATSVNTGDSAARENQLLLTRNTNKRQRLITPSPTLADSDSDNVSVDLINRRRTSSTTSRSTAARPLPRPTRGVKRPRP